MIQIQKSRFLLLIILINIQIFCVDIGELQEIKSSDLSDITINSVLVRFINKKYNLDDDDSFKDFSKKIREFPKIQKKLTEYFEKDLKQLQNFIKIRKFEDNIHLFRQIDFLFNSSSKSKDQINDLNRKLDKLISERKKLKEELRRIMGNHSNEEFFEILSTVLGYLQYCQYKEIFDFLEEKNITVEQEKADIYYVLAEIHFHVFDHENSQLYIDKALAIQPENIFYLKFYAYLLNDLGEAEKSIEINSRVLEIEKRTSGNELSEAANYSSIGASYYKNKEYDKAIENYQKALEISERSLAENDPNIARNYNDLALAYDKKKDFDKAIEFYQRAIYIDLQTVGENNIIVATNYNNLGTAFFNKKYYNKAIENFENAIAIDLKTVGKNDRNTASHYGNLGFAYLKNNDKKNALKSFQKVVDISKKLKIDDWVSYFEKKIAQIK